MPEKSTPKIKYEKFSPIIKICYCKMSEKRVKKFSNISTVAKSGPFLTNRSTKKECFFSNFI